ncbi:hypothetical protein KKF91_08360 [Myxococcota bacterium]|nr:hypothetical protein [Myxococcota bacterium]MBU1430551.1 hypothetical protein [Myxococcota bacterium]MBU1897676.1 hypothetical protein [Myxococcota bacterium]
MLNLYLAPKHRNRPPDEAIEAIIDFLVEHDFVGDEVDGSFTPGIEACELFHTDMHEHLLPAELTFDALSVQTSDKPKFLPLAQPAAEFIGSTCKLCGDLLDEAPLEEALARLAYVPTSRFAYACPSCQSELSLKDIEFNQNTSVARFWIFIEGAATSRLRQSVLDHLGRLLGVELIVVPEVPDEREEDWVPAMSRKRGGVAWRR